MFSRKTPTVIFYSFEESWSIIYSKSKIVRAKKFLISLILQKYLMGYKTYFIHNNIKLQNTNIKTGINILNKTIQFEKRTTDLFNDVDCLLQHLRLR